MTRTPHLRYRPQLSELASDSKLLSLMTAAPELKAWFPREQTWRRLCGCFHPEQNAYASLILAPEGPSQRPIRVEVFERKPSVATNEGIAVSGDKLGWLHFRRFTTDEKLPTLAKTLATHNQATIVQYWPRRRCTVRVEGLGEPHFVKFYPKKFLLGERGAKIHDIGVALWEASARGEVAFKVPKPIAWDGLSLTLTMERLAGIPAAANLNGPDALLQANRIGRASASITLMNITPFRTFDYGEQLKDSAEYARELARRAPHLSESIEQLLARLKLGPCDVAGRPLVPVHGDMHIGQWLDNDGELGLLDFDDFALGHPERDVAFFIVQLEHECPWLLQTQYLNAAFLEGYEAVAGSLNRKLMRAYMAHKWLAKALRSVRELRSDGDVRAGQNLKRALSCMES